MAANKEVLRHFARTGYAARGVVYLIVGVLALLAAFGQRDSEGTQGALQSLIQQPFGNFMLWLVAIGLAGHALWRLIQAFTDADAHGSSPKGLTIRGAFVVSGLTYLALSLYAFDLLGVFSSGAGGSEGTIRRYFAGFVGNRLVSLGLCAIFLGVAMAHWNRAARHKYRKFFAAPARYRQLVDWISVTGLTARGFVFAVLAALLFYRGTSAAGGGSDTPGLEEALEFVQGLPFGGVLLALLGLGLICFAAYSFLEAIWRRINMMGVRV